VVRTLVFGRRTFPVPCSTCSWRVTTNVVNPSAIGQPTRPTQPFILPMSINWVVSYVRCVLPHSGGAIWWMLTEKSQDGRVGGRWKLCDPVSTCHSVALDCLCRKNVLYKYLILYLFYFSLSHLLFIIWTMCIPRYCIPDNVSNWSVWSRSCHRQRLPRTVAHSVTHCQHLSNSLMLSYSTAVDRLALILPASRDHGCQTRYQQDSDALSHNSLSTA